MTTQRYYWVAINGPSAALSTIPLSRNVQVKPTPQQLIGFPTLDEARDVQWECLHAPIEIVKKRFAQIAKRQDICVINPTHPDVWKPSMIAGSTRWTDGPEVPNEKT